MSEAYVGFMPADVLGSCMLSQTPERSCHGRGCRVCVYLWGLSVCRELEGACIATGRCLVPH